MAPETTAGPAKLLRQLTRHWDDFLRGRVGKWVVGRQVQQFAVAVFLVARGFVVNRGPIRAAALSYTTLLALVPLLAVMLSVSKNFLKETSADVVPALLDRAVALIAPQLEHVPLPADAEGPPAPGQPQVSAQGRAQVVAQIQSFIDGIDAGKLGTAGMLLLIVVALRLMTTIEHTFNDFWGVQAGRSLWKKIVYYWSAITLGPLLIVVAMYLTGRLEFMRHQEEVFFALAWAQRAVLNVLPFVVLWLAFTALYALMPNTYVRPRAALIGGIVAGTLWQLNSLLSTLYISRVVTYSTIYGGLGLVPVFLIGVYFSWLIILFGAQVSFAAQNIQTYLQQRACERVDQRGRELTACQLMLVAVEHFLNAQPPPTLEQLATRLAAPIQLLNQVAHRLRQAGLVATVADSEGGVAPARSPATIRVTDVLTVMRTSGEAESPGNDPLPASRLTGLLHDLNVAAEAADANLTFSELVNRAARPA